MYIYLLFTDTGTLLNKTIKKVTKAPYNHVSISLSEDLKETYSFGRKKPCNPLIAGFIKEDFFNGTFSYFPNTKCCVLKVKIEEEEFKRISYRLDYFKENQSIMKYNKIGLFLYNFKLNIKRKNHYFCSEFVSELLGDKLFPCERTNLVSPEDIRKKFNEHMIYEGLLFEYPNLNVEILHFNKYRKHIPLYNFISSVLAK